MVRRISQSFNASLKARLLFVQVRAGHDGIHEVALVLHQSQGALEMRLSGVLFQGLAQNTHALVQIWFDFNLPIDLGNQRQTVPAAAVLRCHSEAPEKSRSWDTLRDMSGRS